MLSGRAVPQRPPLKQRPRGESHRIPGNPAKVGQRTKGGGVRPLQPLSPELGCGFRLSVGSQLRSEASFLLRSLHQDLVAPQDEVQSLAWLARLPGTQCWPASPASSPRLSEQSRFCVYREDTWRMLFIVTGRRLSLRPKRSGSLSLAQE
ncbi:unnamed protein product [Rangifer tarandus platyrhynchus]|uniref:Uncharacterized protein n=3 Tax=Rangifer tarandus platyrhynchus TaxID=3082113 RepID=A0ACB0EYZ4_RANTA|nr:unnamed protein product [Rangifer tarandus platyrhynchus]CAI9705965.1 unnamed protein product [Rangifer tarandus platyrhynchus]